VQRAAAAAEYCPLAQLAQLVPPADAWYAPAVQIVHVAAAAAE
jgi:hypothetical protein